MKRAIQIGLVVCICVLLSSAAPARSQQAPEPASAYQLTALPLRACAALAGGGYVLTPAVIDYTGTPCCCVYLPSVVR